MRQTILAAELECAVHLGLRLREAERSPVTAWKTELTDPPLDRVSKIGLENCYPLVNHHYQ